MKTMTNDFIVRKQVNQENFFANFEKFNFNINKTCAEIGISRDTYYYWFQTDADFKIKLDEYKNRYIDQAQSVLFDVLMHSKSDMLRLDAAKFVLKTLGKDRGYQENIDITSNKQQIKPVTINILSNMIEEAKQIDDGKQLGE